jgi:hypothetical protein
VAVFLGSEAHRKFWPIHPPGCLHTLTRLQYCAWREAAALFQLGNPAWDAAFGRVLPQAAAHVRTLLGLPAGADAANTPAVHFGGNSHELVARLLSSFLEARRGGDNGGGMLCTLRPLRLLTTDTEFYSFTRQLNRFVGECLMCCASPLVQVPACRFQRLVCGLAQSLFGVFMKTVL